VTVAFVLSGGASLGSIQVGMAAALRERDINPDLIVGTSVGAINGSWLAGGGAVDELAEVWRSLRRKQLFPLRPVTGWRGFTGRATHFVPDSGLRRLLTRHLRFQNLEDAVVPFQVIAADAQTGQEVVLRRGPALESVLASAALPAVFPPVEVEGRLLIDGGVVNNAPVTTAIDAGATEVWVLSTGYSCRLPAPPSTALAMAAHSIALLVQQRLVLESRVRDYPVPVHFIPPPCPISVTPVDFSQTDELIDRAMAGTRQWLGNGCPDAMPLLMPHDHDEAGLPHMR
jgi:NTE family protein